jgi:DNA-directed RNA polymerase subunit RPC12/RpoP
MGKQFLEFLETSHIYTCSNCGTHLSNAKELISKDFWAGTGKAFLFNKVVNYMTGQPEDRMLRTGLHTVSDIFCKVCESKVGWRYDWAMEQDQKYKEGKSILERSLITKIEWT